MGKKCDVCGRSSTKGASRSHSNIKTLKRQGINLQTKTIMGMKAKVCTNCLRTMKKNEAIDEAKKELGKLKNKVTKKEIKAEVKKATKK